jgi:hypothetical protein
MMTRTRDSGVSIKKGYGLMTAPLILYFRLVFLMEGVVTIKDTQRITPLTKKGKIGIKNL